MTQSRQPASPAVPGHPARTPDQRAIDAFVQLDEELMRENRQPDSRSPREHTIAEACAVRILVKHYGWVAVEPGVLRRHRA